MVCLGPDIFAPKINSKKTLDSTKLIASFFDETNEITKLEDQFSKGYVSGITHAISNFKQILSNKFKARSYFKTLQNMGTKTTVCPKYQK
jgi:hypothetical protein